MATVAKKIARSQLTGRSGSFVSGLRTRRSVAATIAIVRSRASTPKKEFGRLDAVRRESRDPEVDAVPGQEQQVDDQHDAGAGDDLVGQGQLVQVHEGPPLRFGDARRTRRTRERYDRWSSRGG